MVTNIIIAWLRKRYLGVEFHIYGLLCKKFVAKGMRDG